MSKDEMYKEVEEKINKTFGKGIKSKIQKRIIKGIVKALKGMVENTDKYKHIYEAMSEETRKMIDEWEKETGLNKYALAYGLYKHMRIKRGREKVPQSVLKLAERITKQMLEEKGIKGEDNGMEKKV